MAVVVVPASVLLSILAGYAFGMMRFRGAKVLFYVFLLGLMVPIEATIVPLYYDLRALGLTDTYWALILPQVGRGRVRDVLDAGVLPLGAALAGGGGADRRRLELDDAVARSAAVRAARGADDDGAAVHVDAGTSSCSRCGVHDEPQTAPLGLAFFSGPQHDRRRAAAAGAVIVATPVVIVFIFLQRHFIRGMLTGAVKG